MPCRTLRAIPALHPLRLPVSACSCLCCPASVCACLRLPRLTCAPAAVCFTCEFCFLAAICAGELFPDCSFFAENCFLAAKCSDSAQNAVIPGFCSQNSDVRKQKSEARKQKSAVPRQSRAGQGIWAGMQGRASGMLGCKARQGIWDAGQLGRAAGWDAGQGSWVGMLGRASGR